MEINQLEAESDQFSMNFEIKELDPYLEEFEIILPDLPITPFTQFRVLVKASGSDLPCDGKWFKISVAGLDLSDAKIISQPQGKTIGFGMTGEWSVELQAPMDVGEYWLHTSMESVETDRAIVKTPFRVVHNSDSKTTPFLLSPLFFSVVVLGAMLGLTWLLFSNEIKIIYNNWRGDVLNESSTSAVILKRDETSERVKINNKQQTFEHLKTKATIDELLEKSFTDISVTNRQKAWKKVSQFIDSQSDSNNPYNSYVLEIQQKRTEHKLQMEKWLASNENPQELLKRLLVLAFVDDDENAQRWLGSYYASEKNIAKDLGKTWRWYQRAANKGSAKSQKLLDELERQADQLLESSKPDERIKGYEITEAVASAGGINAQLWMGYRYESGDGVPKNLNVAASWYRKAAEQGNSFAKGKLEKVLSLIAKQKK
ncbi:MAG: sel1 repeat family protein [Methylococcaceae bacterium]|nr:sel1 repeat family protein [Methylococcaceae bacterium]